MQQTFGTLPSATARMTITPATRSFWKCGLLEQISQSPTYHGSSHHWSNAVNRYWLTRHTCWPVTNQIHNGQTLIQCYTTTAVSTTWSPITPWYPQGLPIKQFRSLLHNLPQSHKLKAGDIETIHPSCLHPSWTASFNTCIHQDEEGPSHTTKQTQCLWKYMLMGPALTEE